MLLSPIIELETRKSRRLDKRRGVMIGWVIAAALILWLDSLHREGILDFDALSFAGGIFVLFIISDRPEATVASAGYNREYIATLIKADRHFADAMLVLGDALFVEEDYELAMRAYIRAMHDLKHPANEALQVRNDRIYKIWTEEADRKKGYIVRPMYRIQSQARTEFLAAADWLQQFQKIEAARIGVRAPVDFAVVKEAMKAQGVREPVNLEMGVFKGKISSPTAFLVKAVTVVVLTVVGLLIGAALLRILRNRRRQMSVSRV